MHCLKEFISFFNDNPPVFLNDESTKMRVNGKLFDYSDPAQMDKLFEPGVILKYKLNEWYEQAPTEKLDQLRSFIESSYRQDVAERKEKIAKLNKAIESSPVELPDVELILNNIQPARIVGDVRREGGYCFIDIRTGMVTEYDFHAISLSLQREFPKKEIDRFMSNVAHVKPVYDPFGGPKLEKIEDSNAMYALNTYRPPEWVKIQTVEPKCDDMVMELLTHLFPNEKCLEFFFTWVYHSWNSRAGTYLYLNGAQGTGKNTVADLLTEIHGWTNSTHPKPGMLKNRFNHFLKDKRFVFLDEFNCRKREDKDFLKLIINEKIQVEGKQRDHEEITVYSSYMIANNSEEAIGLEPVDRRFSVPEITHDSIIEAKGRAFIKNVIKKINEPQVIANFMAWLLEEYKYPKWDSEEPYQTKRFEEIVLATARSGINQTLEKIFKKEQKVYDYYEEKEMFLRKNKTQHFPAVQDWLKFFREAKKDGELLGHVDGMKVIPDLKYMPEGRDQLV